MEKPKVLVVVIAKRYKDIKKRCLKAIEKQNYPNFSVMISIVKAQKLDEDAGKSSRKNIRYNRNYSRQLALASDADYFFLVDSDIVVPKDAISKLMVQLGPRQTTSRFLKPDGTVIEKGTPVKEKHIMSGWYQLHEGGWNAGRWIADNLLGPVIHFEHSVVRVDKADNGCLMISRKVLEQVDWEDNFTIDILNPDGTKRHPCTCLMFCRKAQDKGFDIWMDGDVICKHIIRSKEFWSRLKIKLKLKIQHYVFRYNRWFNKNKRRGNKQASRV